MPRNIQQDWSAGVVIEVGDGLVVNDGTIATTGWTSLASGAVRSGAYRLYATTTGATAVRLTENGSAASSSNVANLPNNSSMLFTAQILIFNQTTNKSATFYVNESLATRGANAASTVVTLNGGGVTAGPASASPFTLAANPTITADTTNGGFNVSYTPPTANTDTFWAICYLRLITLRNV